MIYKIDKLFFYRFSKKNYFFVKNLNFYLAKDKTILTNEKC